MFISVSKRDPLHNFNQAMASRRVTPENVHMHLIQVMSHIQLISERHFLSWLIHFLLVRFIWIDSLFGILFI